MTPTQRPTITIRRAPATFIAKLRADHPDWNIIHKPERYGSPWEGGLLILGITWGNVFFGIVGDLISIACVITLAVRWKLVRR